jgi:hypothetical protein
VAEPPSPRIKAASPSMYGVVLTPVVGASVVPAPAFGPMPKKKPLLFLGSEMLSCAWLNPREFHPSMVKPP